MEAILASPSQFSPPLSPSNSSPGSPLLPALSSPFELTSLKALSPQPTPTKVNSVESHGVPSWMTDELDEEWIPQDPDEGAEEGGEEDAWSSGSVVITPRKPSALPIQSNNSIKSNSSAFGSLNKPRVPSSLRYALAPNTSPARPAHLSHARPEPSPGSENKTPASSSAGTFVIRSTPSNSYRLSGEQGQLQAAARAMRGAQGGLGADPVEEVGEGEVQLANIGGKVGLRTPGKDRLGLMSLFESSPPPTNLASPIAPTVAAPSRDHFTFSPPALDPAPVASTSRLAESDLDSTPLGRPPPRGLQASATSSVVGDYVDASDATPVRAPQPQAPPIPARDRYLHRPAAPTLTEPGPEPGLAPVVTPATGTQKKSLPRILGPSPALHPIPATPVALTHRFADGDHSDDFSDPAAPAPAPASDGAGSPHKLFEFHYDTYTKSQLASLVDEIDTGTRGHGTMSTLALGGRTLELVREDDEDTGGWGDSFVSATQGNDDPRTQEQDTQAGADSDDSLNESLRRASKRIRLSPKEEPAFAISPENRRTAQRAKLRREANQSGFRTALGASIARRRGGPAKSPSPSPTRLRDSATRMRQSLASSMTKSDASPGPSRTTKQRRAQANELMDQLRSRAVSEALTSSPSVGESTIVPINTPFSDASTVVPRTAASRFRSGEVSPRKLLRRLSGADEVDDELAGEETADLSASVALGAACEEDNSVEERAALPKQLAAVAAASIRNALSQSDSLPGSPFSRGTARQSKWSAGVDLTSSVQASTSTPTETPARPQLARAPVGSVAPWHAVKLAAPSALNSSNLGPAEMATQAKLAAGVFSAFSATDILSQSVPTRRAAVAPTARKSHTRHQSITTIGPAEAQALLAGSVPARMMFDPAQKRWLRQARPSLAGSALGEGQSQSTEEDAFRDFETTKGTQELELSRLGDGAGDLSGLGISERTPVVVAGESPADKCYFERLPVEEAEKFGDLDAQEDADDSAEWTKAGEGEDHVRQLDQFEPGYLGPGYLDGVQSEPEMGSCSPTQELEPAFIRRASVQASPVATLDQPRFVSVPTRASSTPTHRSTVAQPVFTPRAPATTRAPASISCAPPPASVPRSALKQVRRFQSDPTTPGAFATSTPNGRLGSQPRPPRSVSFSDGRTSGKIEGLIPLQVGAPSAGSRLKFELGLSAQSTEEEREEADRPGPLEMVGDEAEAPVSVRTRRIEDALAELVQPGGNDSVVISTFPSAPRVRPRVVSRSYDQSELSASPAHARSFRRTGSATAADNTFLTQCSFGVSHDKLVQYITDVEPAEHDWADVSKISLAGKGIESLVRMKELLPNLDAVDLGRNQVGFLTGLPVTVRTLLAGHNRLSSLSSFGHLVRLEKLDLSHNQLESVDQLGCLPHLRELNADFNQITNLSGLAKLDGLLRLSLKGNKLESVDFRQANWTRLESLVLSKNHLAHVGGLDRLTSLSLLNLDNNKLTSLDSSAPLPRLRVLRVSANPLEHLDLAFGPSLRTVFADGARLGKLAGTAALAKLENLSLRDQAGTGLVLDLASVEEARRLYLSGNPLPSAFPAHKFFNLTYLELAMCQLSVLPAQLAGAIPNVRVLNMDLNFVEDLGPLAGLVRLRKLTAVGGRVNKARKVVGLVKGWPELEEIDLRMNPLTLGFYPPAVPKPAHAPHADYDLASPSGEGDSRAAEAGAGADGWAGLDKKFRRALPDEWYFKRATYRMAMLVAGPRLVRLDGLGCAGERAKVAGVYDKMVKRWTGQ